METAQEEQRLQDIVTKDTGFGGQPADLSLNPALLQACDPSLRVFSHKVGQYLYDRVVMEIKQLNFLKSASGYELCRALEGCIYVVLAMEC